MNNYYAPDFLVKINGVTLEADVSHAVLDLTYDSNLDMAAMFTLQLNNADYRFTDSALFDVGKTVEIYMGYAGNLHPMMLGDIVKVSPTFPAGGAPTFTVTGYDKSHRLRQNYKIRTFNNMNANAIAVQIAAEHQLIPVMDPSLIPIASKTQQSSDMALLQELAQRTYFETFVDWDKLYFRRPLLQTETFVLEWGRNLSSFTPCLSTVEQVGAISVLDYDVELAQAIVGLVPLTAADLDLETLGERLGSTVLNQLTSAGTRVLADEKVNSFPEAIALAKTLLARVFEGLFEGSGACIGIPELRAGDVVEIRGVGKRFSGRYRLSQVTHTLNESGYLTTFSVTQRGSNSLLQLIQQRLFGGAKSTNKKIEGALIGTVVDNTANPKQAGSIKVAYPSLGKDVENWAKIAPAATGAFFMPDKGDNVVVIFDKGDFDHGFVIARLWNQKQQPPAEATHTNERKIIQSRNGHQIVLDDKSDTGGIILKTANGSTVLIDDQGNIQMVSQAGSKVELQHDGTVRIEAKGNLELMAEGDINLNSSNVNVNMKANGTMEVH